MNIRGIIDIVLNVDTIYGVRKSVIYLVHS